MSGSIKITGSSFDGDGVKVIGHNNQVTTDTQAAAPEPAELPDESQPPTDARVFLSHAGEDVALAGIVVDRLLRLGLDVPEQDVFFSSRARTAPAGGEGWFERINRELANDPMVIALVTDAFMRSQMCLIEAGAAWTRGRLVILLHDTDPGVLAQVQLWNLDRSDQLTEFAMTCAEHLGLAVHPSRWNEALGEFLTLLAGSTISGT